MKEQLQFLRKSKNLTQEDVAHILGVKLSTYQKYERDVISPPYDTLIKIADFYGVSADYLLGRTNILPDPLDAVAADVNDDKFIAMYARLPNYAKRIFVDTMAKLAAAAAEPSPAPPPQQWAKPAAENSLAIARRDDSSGQLRSSPEDELFDFFENIPDSEV